MARRNVGRPRTTRFNVQSADGTVIAVWAEGSGPPLVMVHGSIFDCENFSALIEHLKSSLTTHAINRRGFPPSGDSDVYSAEQEFDDVAAVIEAVASRTGQPVAVFGHSWGASCAMGAAARSEKVSHLILYEPSLGMSYPPGWLAAMEKERAAGNLEKVIQSLVLDVLRGTEADLTELREGPKWAQCLQAAGTSILREAREESEWVYQPGFLAGITSPTLMLVGTESPHALLRASLLAMAELRDVRVQVLRGHGHSATSEDPTLVASAIERFMR